MNVYTQIRINSDPRLISFIRQKPIWYKLLNRDPNLINDFVKDMKDAYKLNTSDKINKTLDNISLIQTFLSVLK